MEVFQYSSTGIDHIHVKLLVHIGKEPDIELTIAWIWIDPDRIGKNVVPLYTIIHRHIHIERCCATKSIAYRIGQVLNPYSRCGCIERIARNPRA